MQVVARYAGFEALVNELKEGLEITSLDTEGREINREMFPEITDSRLKQEHIDAQLKKFWEHRIDSN